MGLVLPLVLSLFVSTEAGVQPAYEEVSQSPGGGTVHLTADFPARGQIVLSGGGPEPVVIAPAEPGTRQPVGTITIRNAENIAITGLHVDSTGLDTGDWARDVDISGARGIEIRDTLFTSNGRSFYDPANPASVLGARLALVRSSADITFADNEASGYSQGITFRGVANVVFTGNDFHTMQGDGLRLVDVDGAMVAGNYFHDFAGSPHEFNHDDFIQMWPEETSGISRNITITRNVLDSGGGAAAQGIFMRNPGDATGRMATFRNIEISHNVIYTASAQGIGVSSAQGLRIAYNTVLWNPRAVIVKADGNTSYAPRIGVGEGSTGAEVFGNIAPGYRLAPGVAEAGNIVASWDPSDPGFVGGQFLGNTAAGGDIGPAGWQLRPGSAWIGHGAAASQPGG